MRISRLHSIVLVSLSINICLVSTYAKGQNIRSQAMILVSPKTNCMMPNWNIDYREIQKSIVRDVMLTDVCKKKLNKCKASRANVCRYWNTDDMEVKIEVGISRFKKYKDRNLAQDANNIVENLLLRVTDVESGIQKTVDLSKWDRSYRSVETHGRAVTGLPNRIGKNVGIYLGPKRIEKLDVELQAGKIYRLTIEMTSEIEGIRIDKEQWFFLVGSPRNRQERGLKKYEDIRKKELANKKYDATGDYKKLSVEYPGLVAPRDRLYTIYCGRKMRSEAINVAKEIEKILPEGEAMPYSTHF